MSRERLIEVTERGLYCAVGKFHIDPWRPVDRAVVTHAHSDHATWGCEHYLASKVGVPILAQRVHQGADITGLDYGETTTINGVKVSLHPAGHLLGSAQVRVEHAGRVEVVSGDYKVTPDGTCEPFEVVRCDRFITESTFGLPIYRWGPDEAWADDLLDWWRGNAEAGQTTVVFAYALGKAQRVLHTVAERAKQQGQALPGGGAIVCHGSVQRFNELYAEAGVAMPATQTSTEASRQACKGRGLVVAPPSVLGTTWLRRFAPYRTAFASGWMHIRGNRRRRGVDRGFVVSDHADWPGLLQTIRDTGCESVGVTHGYTQVLVRYLREQGIDADVVPTRYEGESEEGASRQEAGDAEET
ncbi:MAG: ligase-associated DNA damage response exonuclease [Planctomycetota bacterium]